MHELSLCRSIHGIVDRARGDRGVSTVHLQVGQLRQVVPDTLAYCWGLVTQFGPLADSELDIDHIPVVLACHHCGQETAVADVLVLVCGSCGSGEVRVLSGEEFLVTSIDLTPLPPPQAIPDAAPAAQPTGEGHG